MHVSHLCIDHRKVHFLICTKITMMIFFILWRLYPSYEFDPNTGQNYNTRWIFFVLSVHRVTFFAHCVRIASTRFLPGTQRPII